MTPLLLTATPEHLDEARQWLNEHNYRRDVAPAAWDKIVAHIAAYKAGVHRRGLLLWGRPGLGKTLLATHAIAKADGKIKTASELIDKFKQHNGQFSGKFWADIYGLYPSYSDLGDDDEFASYAVDSGKHFVIDDVKNTPITKVYGNATDVIGEIIEQRYQAWENELVEGTHITTNMTLPALQQRYGSAVMDRLLTMCVPIEFQGASVRERDQREKQQKAAQERAEAEERKRAEAASYAEAEAKRVATGGRQTLEQIRRKYARTQ